MNIVLLGIGGALGAVSRYKLGLIFSKYEKSGFPLGIFIINVLGALLLGIVCGLNIKGNPYILLGDGFCGAFTTFSTFMAESVSLIKKNEVKKSILFITLSVMIGLVSFLIGYIFMKMLLK